MSTETKTSSHGLTFLGALQVLFIGLKLTGFIDWPWWQVLLPVVIDVAILVVLLVLLGIAVYREYTRSH